MRTGSLVVVTCAGPREKFFGVLLELTAVGGTIRGLPLDTFEDWLRQLQGGGEQLIGPVTLFFPAHRLERVEVDETSGAAEGLGDRVRRVSGLDPQDLLGGKAEEAPALPS